MTQIGRPPEPDLGTLSALVVQLHADLATISEALRDVPRQNGANETDRGDQPDSNMKQRQERHSSPKSELINGTTSTSIGKEGEKMLYRNFIGFSVGLILIFVALPLVTISAISTLAGLFMWLAEGMAPSVAAVVTGGVALLTAALAFFTGHWRIRAAARAKLAHTEHAGSRRNDADPIGSELGRLVGNEALRYAQAHPWRALLVTFCSGLATGASPELRRALRGLF
jgi:hypothetical protein